MALKIASLLKDGHLFKNAYVTVQPFVVVKEYPHEDSVKTFRQKYNVDIKSDSGNMNFEENFEMDIERPTFLQCYEHLKTKPEFKTAEND